MKVKRINIDELIDVLLNMKEQNFDYADISIRESDNTLLLAGSLYKKKDDNDEGDDDDEPPTSLVPKFPPTPSPNQNLDNLNNYIA
jgi:hypothetical protein